MGWSRPWFEALFLFILAVLWLCESMVLLPNTRTLLIVAAAFGAWDAYVTILLTFSRPDRRTAVISWEARNVTR